jgi:RNA polymerase sigma-70 factor (ECF subfamily)
VLRAFRNQFESSALSHLDGEREIIKNAVRGEASAFGLLYDHYHTRIYRFVLIKVASREEAEDLTHQVFLAAWEHIGSYRDYGFPFGSWLYRIARNHIVDYYRRRRHEVRLEDVDPNAVPHVFEAYARADVAMQVERVMAALRTMKPEYQDVIIMRFVEELPVREVAAALEKSEGAVKLMQHRAIKELKRRCA